MKEIDEIEISLTSLFKRIDDVCLFNQKKVLDAFRELNITNSNFAGTTGYGYDDIGREKLNKLYAKVFETESAIVSPLITCASHGLAIALFGILRPNETLMAITGKPYDTLDDVIFGTGCGSLKDFHINYQECDIFNQPFEDIETKIKSIKPKLIFVQRSRGYNWSRGLSSEQVINLTRKIKEISPNSLIMLDNCYCEFTYEHEPTKYIDIAVGSLIKNPGGGIANTGAYIVGTEKAIDMVATRYTSSSLKCEVGSYEFGYRNFFQGFFLAPQVVKNAMKGMALIGEIVKKMGYKVMPENDEYPNDIVKSVMFNDKEKLIKFVQLIQKYSPIDSSFVPEPWDMPGYKDPVIMASGSFVGGSSIELSCDAPIREPYIAYIQGGLTYEHSKIIVEQLLLSL